MRYIILLISLVVWACESTEEHGHAHESEAPSSRVATIWTDKTELFVEFPALVVGETSAFAAHFTVLDRHQPVREGKVTVSLIKGNKGIRHTVEEPTSPGIFTPSLQPKEEGLHQLVFDIQTPVYQDRITIDKVQVFGTKEEAEHLLEKENEYEGSISFLKEQAWKINIQTTPVVEGEVFDVINTSGVWKASPGTYKSLVANAGGTVEFVKKILTKGSKINKGQLLMTISSSGLTSGNLTAEIDKARANFEQAKAEYERKQQLYDLDIVPKSELEQVENRYRVAKSTYETLMADYSQGGKQIKAPFSGFIKSISVNNGDYVDQGMALLTIGTHQSRILETKVSISYVSALNNIHNLWYQPKSGKWSSIMESGGSILSVGKEVNSDQPLLPVYAQVNEIVNMPIGSFTEIQIGVGNPREGLLIPESALLEDYGSYTVIVQLTGERFERRPVKIGRRNGEAVEITDGLKAGEMIVTDGAYQVKMASMSGQTPAHGHTH